MCYVICFKLSSWFTGIGGDFFPPPTETSSVLSLHSKVREREFMFVPFIVLNRIPPSGCPGRQGGDNHHKSFVDWLIVNLDFYH